MFGFGQIYIVHQKSRKGGWEQGGRKEGRRGGGEKIVEEGEVVDEVKRRNFTIYIKMILLYNNYINSHTPNQNQNTIYNPSNRWNFSLTIINLSFTEE